MTVLAINGGSSSIRFALYVPGPPLRRLLGGKLDFAGRKGEQLRFVDAHNLVHAGPVVDVADHRVAVAGLVDWLEMQPDFASIKAVGHRIVHGMAHSEPECITSALIGTLHRLTPYVPAHLPLQIELIECMHRRHPDLPQVACFDTAFHRRMPQVARLLAIPRRYQAKGIERYGFHGLSYAYLMSELIRLGDPAASHGRVILAHLGNGASLAAVRDGIGIDTSMGFTPASGLVMGSRSGDLDPGLVSYLTLAEHMTVAQFDLMVNGESGLLGVSETSADLRQLLGREVHDLRAAEAVALFCYQAKKWIGSFAAALGGLDTLVFSGGVGENAPVIRARICADMGYLGIHVNEERNMANAGLISTTTGSVAVRVICTDEEREIADIVCHRMRLGSHG